MSLAQELIFLCHSAVQRTRVCTLVRTPRTHVFAFPMWQAHGWPSFRDNEVVWDNVRCLKNGETVSLDGTHLGHNLPDKKGNRYCINLCCIAGQSTKKAEGEATL